MAYATRRRRESASRIKALKLDKPIKALTEKFKQLPEKDSQRYKSFKIPKRNGKLRQINAPSIPLKEASKELLRIMDKVVIRHKADIGFRPEMGYTDAAVIALSNTTIEKALTLQIDLKDFFPQ